MISYFEKNLDLNPPDKILKSRGMGLKALFLMLYVYSILSHYFEHTAFVNFKISQSSYSEYSELELSSTPGSKLPESRLWRWAIRFDLKVDTLSEEPEPCITELNRPRILELELDLIRVLTDWEELLLCC